MTHIDLKDPKWKDAPISEWGPAWWEEGHEWAETIPCGTCREWAMKAVSGLHDTVNLKTGKTPRYTADLSFLKSEVDKAIKKCHRMRLCSVNGASITSS